MEANLRYPLFVLACASFASMMSMRLAEPLVPSVAEDLGRSVVEAATFVTSFAVAYGVFQLVHGPLADRLGRLRVICVATFAAGLACAASATAASLDGLVLWRFVAGMTAGAVIPVSMAYIGDNVPFEERQAVLGRFMVGTVLGGACGALIGGALSDWVSWRASLFAPAVLFMLVGLALAPLALQEQPSGRGGSPLAPLRVLKASAEARMVCLIVAVEGALVFGAFSFFGAFLRERHALEYSTIGVALATLAIGGLAYAVVVRWLMRHVGRPRMVRLGGVLMGCGFALVGVSPAWQPILLFIILAGFGFSLMHNSLQTLATEMAPTSRGAALAAFAGSLFIGQAFGVELFSLLAERFSLGVVPLVSGGCLLLLGLAFSHWLTRRDDTAPRAQAARGE